MPLKGSAPSQLLAGGLVRSGIKEIEKVSHG